MKRLLAGLTLMLGVVLPGMAYEATPSIMTAEVVVEGRDPWTPGMTDVRAGPDTNFPVVGVVRNGDSVTIQGCMEDYQWCDVSNASLRGWMRARHLSYTAQNQRMIIADHGPSVVVPVLTFVLATYWATHYAHRHWYHQNNHWNHWHYRPLPHRPPGAMLPPHLRPPHARPPHMRPPMVRPPHTPGPGVRPPLRPPHGAGAVPPGARPPLRPPQGSHIKPGRPVGARPHAPSYRPAQPPRQHRQRHFRQAR